MLQNSRKFSTSSDLASSRYSFLENWKFILRLFQNFEQLFFTWNSKYFLRLFKTWCPTRVLSTMSGVMRARKNGSYKGIFAITQVGYYLMRKMFRHYIFLTFEKLKKTFKIFYTFKIKKKYKLNNQQKFRWTSRSRFVLDCLIMRALRLLEIEIFMKRAQGQIISRKITNVQFIKNILKLMRFCY